MEVNDYLKEDEIDIRNIIKVIWKSKIFIMAVVFAFTLSAIIYTYVHKEGYKGQVFIPLNSLYATMITTKITKTTRTTNSINIVNTTNTKEKGVELSVYKRYTYVFNNTPNFINYLKRKNILKEWWEIKSDILKDFYQPVYSDINKSLVIGITFSVKNKNPKKLENLLNIFKEFINYCIRQIQLKEFVVNNYESYIQDMNKIENKLINLNFKIKQLKLKKLGLIQIDKKVGKLNWPNIISIDKGGYRFLPPKIQLAGLESYIFDLKSEIETKEREKIILQNMINYYKEADRYLKNNKEINLKNLEIILNRVLDKKKINDSDEVKFAYNKILKKFKLATIHLSDFSQKQSINRIKSKRKLIIGITFVFSCFLAIFIVFLREFIKNDFKDSSL